MKIKLVLIVLAFSYVFNSCVSIYRPNIANTTFFEEAGDMNVSAFVGNAGIEGQVSISPFSNLFIFGSGSYFYEDSSDIEHTDYVNHRYFETGLGYYNSIGEKGRYTVCGGVGKGNASTITLSDLFREGNHAIGEYYKYYFQNTFGFSTKVVDLGGSIRYNYLDFFKFKDKYTPEISTNNHFIEPTFFIRVGWKNIRYHFQTSAILGLKNQTPFTYEPFRLSFGISINYNPFKKGRLIQN